jgi:hypothetical protein
MSAARPDIVVYCDDGHDEAVVQRFRWLVEQNIWVGTRAAAAEVPIYPGDSPDFPGLDGPVAERGRWPLRCPHRDCGRGAGGPRTVPVRSGRLNHALAWMTHQRQERISLKLLPQLISMWRADVSSPGQYPR